MVPELVVFAVDEVPREERHLGAATVLLPESLVPEVKLRLDAVLAEVVGLGDAIVGGDLWPTMSRSSSCR